MVNFLTNKNIKYMKKMIYRALPLLLVILLHACEYKDIYDAGSEYPVDKVYIAGTYESIIYKVDQIVIKSMWRIIRF